MVLDIRSKYTYLHMTRRTWDIFVVRKIVVERRETRAEVLYLLWKTIRRPIVNRRKSAGTVVSALILVVVRASMQPKLRVAYAKSRRGSRFKRRVNFRPRRKNTKRHDVYNSAVYADCVRKLVSSLLICSLTIRGHRTS